MLQTFFIKWNEMTDKSHFEGEDLRLAQIDESLTSSSKWKTFIDIQLPSALLN